MVGGPRKAVVEGYGGERKVFMLWGLKSFFGGANKPSVGSGLFFSGVFEITTKKLICEG